MIYKSTYFYDPDFEPATQPVVIVDDDTLGSDSESIFGVRMIVGGNDVDILGKRMKRREAVDFLESLSEAAHAAAEHLHLNEE